MRKKVVYIISEIDKALAFEWIAERLDKSSFDLSFILLNGGDSFLEKFLKDRNIPVKRFSCSGKKDWPGVWLKIFFHLKKIKPDVVHCHLLQANILGLSAAKAAGIPQRLYTRHHSDFHHRYFPKGVKWDKFCNRLATKIVAPSGAVKEVLIQQEGVPESKIQVIYHGFDLNYFKVVPEDLVEVLKEKYNPQSRKPVIGVISRFTELKGIQFIIPAFKELLEEFPDALILFFNARGDYASQLEETLSALPAGSYKTVAFENELAAIYRLFDVFVQVSTDTNIEAFGQTYVEALAAGVPSVFTLSGIAGDFIREGENAVVVPFSDSNSIFEGMKRILTDDKLKQRLIKEGARSVDEKFDITKMMRSLENLYSSKNN